MWGRTTFLLICAATLIAPCYASVKTSHEKHSSQEVAFVTALANLRSGNYDQALAVLEKLTRKQPDFKAANYLYADLLQARAGRLKYIAKADGNGHRATLLDEARLRWSHYQNQPPDGAVPNAVLQLAPRYKYVVVVDLHRNRLFLLKNTSTGLHVIADFYATIGAAGAGKYTEGDNKTPIGIYRMTEYKPGDTLPAIYGRGAFPLNYPNDLDRLFGRTGHGIWVHGVPASTFNRPPQATEGCVAIPNQDLALVKRYVRPGITPVVLTNHLVWLTPEAAKKQRDAILRRLQGWRSQWVSGDTSAYLGYYSQDFIASSGSGKPELASYQRHTRSNATQLQVKFDDISIFRYPGDAVMALVTFTQHKTENGQQSTANKRQYWRRGANSNWQIVYTDSKQQTLRTAAN